MFELCTTSLLPPSPSPPPPTLTFFPSLKAPCKTGVQSPPFCYFLWFRNQIENPEELLLKPADAARQLWIASDTDDTENEHVTQRRSQYSRQEVGYALLNSHTMMVSQPLNHFCCNGLLTWKISFVHKLTFIASSYSWWFFQNRFLQVYEVIYFLLLSYCWSKGKGFWRTWAFVRVRLACSESNWDLIYVKRKCHRDFCIFG